MPNKVIDLTGQKFGKLTVIERAENDSQSRTQWLCQCECGNKKIIKSSNLRRGFTKSCGCLAKETAAKLAEQLNKKNLIGQHFGKLLVLEELEERASNGSIIYKCQCECGNICEVRTDYLTCGVTTSCGCSKKISKGEEEITKILTENNIPFETQKTFDKCRFKSGFPARFDFYVDNKYLIEFDGIQHFFETKFSHDDFKIRQEHDKIKNEYCLNNNIPLIRIPYTKCDTLCLEDLLLDTTQFLINKKEEYNVS